MSLLHSPRRHGGAPRQSLERDHVDVHPRLVERDRLALDQDRRPSRVVAETLAKDGQRLAEAVAGLGRFALPPQERRESVTGVRAAERQREIREQ